MDNVSQFIADAAKEVLSPGINLEEIAKASVDNLARFALNAEVLNDKKRLLK